jgi:hypothetical protein
MRRTYAAGTLLAALVLAASACSADKPTDESGNDPPGQEAELAHAQCMRDHGIDWPDPEFVDGEWELRLGGEVDLESTAFKDAEAECARLRQDGQPDVDNPADRAQQEEDMARMLEFASCMRDQGLDFPDPQMDDDGNISGPAGPADGDGEAFSTAREACEDETGQPMP